jgi:hypothetical protein
MQISFPKGRVSPIILNENELEGRENGLKAGGDHLDIEQGTISRVGAAPNGRLGWSDGRIIDGRIKKPLDRAGEIDGL